MRVTVQYYKYTSTGEINDSDMAAIAKEINHVYAIGGYSGSLVVSGDTGRVTEYYGAKIQPADWWQEFWKRYESNTGESREDAESKLRGLIGDDYRSKEVSEFYLRRLLR